MSDPKIRAAAEELAREVRRRQPRHVNEMATVVSAANLISNGTVEVRRRDNSHVTAVAWTQADLQKGDSCFIAPMHDDGHNKRWMVVSAKADSRTGKWNSKWEENKRYEKGDIVRYARKTWICIKRVKDDLPPPDDDQHWDKHTESPVQNAGKWEANKTYDEGDLVRWNGRQWISLKDDNANKEPGTSPNWWERFAGEGNDLGEWNAQTAYEADDIVSYRGRRYLCIADTFAGIQPEVSPDWELFWRLYVGGVAERGRWEQNKQYYRDDVVRWKGRTWIAVANSLGNEPTKTSNKWEVFADKGVDTQGPWQAGVVYAVDAVVTYEGRSFICVFEHDDVEPTVTPGWTGYWQIFVDKPVNDRGKYDENADYVRDDAVQHRGQTWVCIKKLTQSGSAPACPPGDRAGKEFWKKYAGAGTVDKGEWLPGVLYELDDVVTYGGTVYRAKQDQTFSVEPGTLNSDAYWEVHTAGSALLDEDWSNLGVKYKRGQVVRHKGNLWRCRNTHTSSSANAPGKDDSLWKLYVEKGGEVRTNSDGSTEWKSTEEYDLGDIVSYNGATWRCISKTPISGTANEPSNSSTKWKKISVQGKAVTEWAAGVAYEEGDIVIYNGRTWRANRAITAAENTSAAEPDDGEIDGIQNWPWTLLSGRVPNFVNKQWSELSGSVTIRVGDIYYDNISGVKTQFIATKKQKGQVSTLKEPWKNNATPQLQSGWEIFSQGAKGDPGEETIITNNITNNNNTETIIEGTPGPPGEGFSFKGNFKNEFSYQKNDVFVYNGRAYVIVCTNLLFTENSTPQYPPPSGACYQLFTEKGADGGGGMPLVFELLAPSNGVSPKIVATDSVRRLGKRLRLPVDDTLSTAVGARIVYGISFGKARSFGNSPKFKIGLQMRVGNDVSIPPGYTANLINEKIEWVVSPEGLGYKQLFKSSDSGTDNLTKLKQAKWVQATVTGSSASAPVNYVYLLVYFGNPDQMDDGTEGIDDNL